MTENPDKIAQRMKTVRKITNQSCVQALKKRVILCSNV